MRLRHAETGVVVSVADEKSARMGREWVEVERPKPAKKAAPRKRAAKKSE